eukprot:6057186-Prymnesium_polylepis.1
MRTAASAQAATRRAAEATVRQASDETCAMVGPPGMEGSVVEVGAVAELAPMPPFGIRRLRDAPDDASHAAPAAVLAAVEA